MSLIPGGQQLPTLTIGGRVFTDLSNLIILGGNVTASANKTSLRKPDGTSGYSPSGVNFNMFALQVISLDTNAPTFDVGWSQNDVGNDTTNATGTYTRVFGSSAFSNWAMTTTSKGNILTLNFKFVVPSTRFLTLVGGGGTSPVNFLAYGYEG